MADGRESSERFGELGADAAAFLRTRGSLLGIRAADVGTWDSPLPGRDYRGADLTSADLSGHHFKGYDFRAARLRLATLDGAFFLRCRFVGADLRGTSLRRASFAACELMDADFRDADLTGARFGVASDTTGWLGCDLTGAQLQGATLRGIDVHPNTRWTNGALGGEPDQLGRE